MSRASQSKRAARARDRARQRAQDTPRANRSGPTPTGPRPSWAGAHRESPFGARTRSQAFRAAFLRGFGERIGERLSEVSRLAYADAQAGTFLPVLRSQRALIDDFLAERFGGTVSNPVRGGFDAAGYARGQLAGDAAALTSGRITG